MTCLSGSHHASLHLMVRGLIPTAGSCAPCTCLVWLQIGQWPSRSGPRWSGPALSVTWSAACIMDLPKKAPDWFQSNYAVSVGVCVCGVMDAIRGEGLNRSSCKTKMETNLSKRAGLGKKEGRGKGTKKEQIKRRKERERVLYMQLCTKPNLAIYSIKSSYITSPWCAFNVSISGIFLREMYR